jgi:hypothetical protein
MWSPPSSVTFPAGVGTSTTINWPVLVLLIRTVVTSPVGTTQPRRNA